MAKTLPFEKYTAEYDEWFDKYPAVFESEVEALRDALPIGDIQGIEVGLGTGRFSVALGIKEGIEPAEQARKIAMERGIETIPAVAEKLPYKDLHFDFVLMASSISYFDDINTAFKEASRVLKRGGVLIVGFLDKNGIIAESYEQKRQDSKFYKQASFYSVEKVSSAIKNAGFYNLQLSQTLFKPLDEIKELEPAEPGVGKGSFVVVKAMKK